MLPTGHAAGGYIVGTIAAFLAKGNSTDDGRFRLLGVVGGVLPDTDLAVYYSIRKRLNLPNWRNHHTWVTHTFPFYLLPGGLLTVWALKKKRPNLAKYSATVTMGACTHLLQDMYGSGYGIQPLYPFSKRMMGVRLLQARGEEWLRRYFRERVFLVELLFVIIAFLMLLRDFRKRVFKL